MQKLILICSMLTASLHTFGQTKPMEMQVGYWAPYLVNVGASVGYGVEIQRWNGSAEEPSKHTHRLQLLSQLGYFTQLDVNHNAALNPELVYKWNRTGKRFYLMSSIGAGYLISWQRESSSVNLGSGELEHQYAARNFFLPTINVGLGVDPKKHVGFHFKAFYGARLSGQTASSSFFGLSTGITININPQNQ